MLVTYRVYYDQGSYVIECARIFNLYLSTLEYFLINDSIIECSWRHNFYVTILFTQVPAIPIADNYFTNVAVGMNAANNLLYKIISLKTYYF